MNEGSPSQPKSFVPLVMGGLVGEIVFPRRFLKAHQMVFENTVSGKLFLAETSSSFLFKIKNR